MAIENREIFLKKIAARLGKDEVSKKIEKPQWKYAPQKRVLKGASQSQLIEVLKNQCKLIHTDLIETSLANLPQTLEDRVSDYGGESIVTWRDSRLKEWGVTSKLDELHKQGVAYYEWNHEAEAENIALAEKANIGLTISEITLAESGTVVLFSDKHKGRTVSFLPEKSIILVPRSSIVPRMTQAADYIREKIKESGVIPSCINFITGPSNSADIEMNLVVGVHGPINATYMIISDL
ncbi:MULTISPECIES: LutC/YkgG family protein [Cytobacillus]|uniref:Lactate utilization protein C n=1 Tax=Cytobacillus stercorigallinarum TaxID=2762240 RepID=A0ABR8QSR9_9BACI|nr:lactate utilization protein C [Cytobacillus stercorigallinarum]MBD7938585.1 lactate utilization protein C [Cytobacillus stercorigallinarum]